MFEQSLYNQPEPEQQPPQEGDLFRDYEVGRWNFSKRIYQIFAIAAIFNILGIAFLAQTNVLTARGCDSPFVGRVCQVLDTVYIGALLFGTERDYVDVAYERTELADADITFIDVSTPLFEYPANYFQPPAVDPYATQMDPMAGFSPYPPGFTPNPTVGNDILNTKPILPKPNPVQDDGPDSLFGRVVDDSPKTTPGMARKRKFGKGKVSDETVAQATPTPTPDPTPEAAKPDPVTGDVYNSRPLSDLRVLVKETIAKSGLNLQSDFTFNAKAKLTKEGKIDPKTFKYGEVKGDEKLIKIIKESIGAFSDSGRLQVLRDLSGKDLNFSLTQDDLFVSTVIQTEVENESMARAIRGSLKLLIDLAISSKENSANPDENDKDDLALLKGATIEQDGKNLVIKFVIPKDMAHKMIQRKLDEVPKPNGTAKVSPNNNSASR